MTIRPLWIVAALALAAACDKPAPAPQSNASGGSSTPGTPANLGQPSSQEKREGANPQQGQVDPKEPAQHKDFRQSGDQKDPTGPDTQPKSGG